MSIQKTACPECEEPIEREDPRVGQIIDCDECGAELEVTGAATVDAPLNMFTVELAEEELDEDEDEDEY